MKHLLLSLTCVLSVSAFAGDAENRGLEIAKEGDRRDTGFGASTVSLSMLLTNKHGDESLRDMRNKTIEVEGDGDRTMLVFDQPRDVKGTALLTYTHKTKSDDQWLYLPALKRVKRISSKNKSGPFMGSEFAYEDFASQEIEKYTYKYLKDDDVDGKATFLIERDPVDKYSGYSYQHLWIDKEEYIPVKIDFYDRKKSLLKTLVFQDYKQYKNKYWRADRMLMVNHQTGKSTLLTWSNYNFSPELSNADFSKNALKRAR